MKSRPKDLGTAFETWLVNNFKRIGLFSRRLPEGGSLDLGDLEVVLDNGMTFIVEAKAREVLNVTREMEKARVKSGDGVNTILIWKRLTKEKGKKRRTPDGQKIVCVIGIDTLELLLTMTDKK